MFRIHVHRVCANRPRLEKSSRICSGRCLWLPRFATALWFLAGGWLARKEKFFFVAVFSCISFLLFFPVHASDVASFLVEVELWLFRPHAFLEIFYLSQPDAVFYCFLFFSKSTRVPTLLQKKNKIGRGVGPSKPPTSTAYNEYKRLDEK